MCIINLWERDQRCRGSKSKHIALNCPLISSLFDYNEQHHNIIQIHNNGMWDWQHYAEYSKYIPTFSYDAYNCVVLFTIYESNTIECYIALHMPNNLVVGGSVVLIC